MNDPTYIENYIIDFVDRHVSEKVRFKFGHKCIQISPVKKRGSILLSMFWIKVLQHKDNFPPQTVSYNQKKENETEIIYILTENVMISLDLLTGLLTVEGEDFIEWFRTRIITIVQNYIGCKTSYSSDGDRSIKLRSITSQTTPPYHIQNSFKQSSVLEDEHLSDLLTGTLLESACESVRKSSLKPANTFIYRFWKSLIYDWLSRSINTHIVVATSRIDARRMKDIADIGLLLSSTSQIQAVYLPLTIETTVSSSGVRVATSELGSLHKSTMAGYSSKEQLWLEYELFSRILIPQSETAQTVGCNFIAGLLPSRNVEMLVTSCPFHKTGLDQPTLHTLQFLTMTESEFDRDFIVPIHSQIRTQSCSPTNSPSSSRHK